MVPYSDSYLAGMRKDFRNFMHEVWKYLNLPPPTTVQYDIAFYLQHGPDRSGVEAFRGVGKSYITSAFCAWCWFGNADEKIMVVSASKDRADDFSMFTKNLLDIVPFLNYLSPNQSKVDRNRLDKFDLAGIQPEQSPSCKSVGINGQLTGSRADKIIFDDVEVPANSRTETMRELLLQLVGEAEAILKPLPTSRIIYLGTPQCEESLYNTLVSQRGYKFRIWPIEVPDKKTLTGYVGELAPMVQKMIDSGSPVGTPVEPTRFPTLEIMKRRAGYGMSQFMMQFLLDTSLSDAERYPLKTSDLIVMDLNPEVAPLRVIWAAALENAWELQNVGFKGDRFYRPMHVEKEYLPYDEILLAIDPSGRGTDETGYCVLARLRSTLYLLAAGGASGGYDESMEFLAQLAKRFKVNRIWVEDNFGDGMWSALFKPVLRKHWDCTVDGDKVHGQKEVRIIDTLEPVLNQHRLIVDRKVIEADLKSDLRYSLFYQLTHITKERGALRHDDRIDVLHLAVRYYLETLAKSQEESHKDYLDEQWEKELEEFIEDAIGMETFSRPVGRRDYLLRRNS